MCIETNDIFPAVWANRMKSIRSASIGKKRDTPQSLISCDDSPNRVYKHSTTTPTRAKNRGGSPPKGAYPGVFPVYTYTHCRLVFMVILVFISLHAAPR